MVSGYWLLDSGHWFLASGFLLVAGLWFLVPCGWLFVSRFSFLVGWGQWVHGQRPAGLESQKVQVKLV
jgi:hypothetical protein